MNKRKRVRRKKQSIKSLRGRGIFKKIGNWITKTAISLTPIPTVMRKLQPKVMKKGWKKPKQLQFLPRGIWRAAGVPEKQLNKWVYFNELNKK